MNLDKFDAKYCISFFSKLRGLMFSKPKNLIFVLNKESRINSAIHTFFVFFPIDVIWLDKNKKIVDQRKNVKPFSVAIPKKKSKYIIELKRKN